MLTCIMRIFLESTISEVANIKTICGKETNNAKQKTNPKSQKKSIARCCKFLVRNLRTIVYCCVYFHARTCLLLFWWSSWIACGPHQPLAVGTLCTFFIEANEGGTIALSKDHVCFLFSSDILGRSFRLKSFFLSLLSMPSRMLKNDRKESPTQCIPTKYPHFRSVATWSP